MKQVLIDMLVEPWPFGLTRWSEVRARWLVPERIRSFTDTTLPTRPVEHEIIWHTPFTKSCREHDYKTAWYKLDRQT